MFRHLGFAYLLFCSVCMQNLNESLKERLKVVIVTMICIPANFSSMTWDEKQNNSAFTVDFTVFLSLKWTKKSMIDNR